jgi:hypothetical protein
MLCLLSYQVIGAPTEKEENARGALPTVNISSKIVVTDLTE